MKAKKKIVVGIAGASGSIYAKVLLDTLKVYVEVVDVEVVMSDNAKINWNLELKKDSYFDYKFKIWDKNDFNAPFASGSAKYDAMIIIPCSMGTMARIAHGISNDLMTRAADVFIKERRTLVLVPRETPFSLVHIKNMELLTLAGTIICPAMPSFYSMEDSVESIVKTVTNRVLDLVGLDIDYKRWGK